MRDDLGDFFSTAEEDRRSLDYKLESAMLSFNSQVINRLDELGLTRTQLAERLDVKPPMISRMLNGNTNYTLKTMVSIASALDCEFDVRIPPVGFKAVSFYVSSSAVSCDVQLPVQTSSESCLDEFDPIEAENLRAGEEDEEQVA